MTIESTLKERGDRYGSFENHAEIAQRLQDVMRGEAGWERLAADQKQALTVIADKIARMLNGDPAYRDNWHDIVGYAKLVDDRMARSETEGEPIDLLEPRTKWPDGFNLLLRHTSGREDYAKGVRIDGKFSFEPLDGSPDYRSPDWKVVAERSVQTYHREPTNS